MRRIMAVAGANEILVSEAMAMLCRSGELSFEDAGEHELKGVPGRWHLTESWSVGAGGARPPPRRGRRDARRGPRPGRLRSLVSERVIRPHDEALAPHLEPTGVNKTTVIVPSCGANEGVNVQVVVGRPLTLKPGGATLRIPTVDDISSPTTPTLVLPPAPHPSTKTSAAELLVRVVTVTVPRLSKLQ